MNDVFYRLLSAFLGGSFAVLAASLVARKCSFYKSALNDDPKRALPLDGLRGLMAWSVFIHHSDIARQWLRTGTWSCDSSLVLFLGKGAVLVFFMITGFLFWGKAVDAEGKLAPFPFWLKRLRRLAPLYLLSAILVFIVVAKAWREAPTPIRLDFTGRLFSLGIVNWARLPGFKLITANAGVQWSLWYEWRFYLALPLLAWLAHGKRIFLLCGVGLLALLSLDFTSLETSYWLAFLPGIAAVYLVRNSSICKTLRGPACAAAAVIWCTVLLILSHFNGYGWSLIAVAPVFWTIAAGNSYWGALIHPATRLLGTISYSVYLLHGILLLAILRFVGKAIDLPTLPLPGYCCIIGATAIVLVLVCSVTYRYVEHPFLSWSPPRKRTSQTQTSSAVQEQVAGIS